MPANLNHFRSRLGDMAMNAIPRMVNHTSWYHH